MSPSTPKATKRRRGEGAVFQRCDADRGCPPRVPVKQEDGSVKLVRPKHKCRGMWIARLDLGDGPDGKPRRPQRSSATQAGAFDALEELRKSVARHGDVPTKNITVETWLTRWLDELVKPRKDPRTYDFYRGHVVNNLIPRLGERKLDQLRPQHVRAMFAAMKERGVASSRGGAHRTLRKALNDAMSEGLLMQNVAKLVSAPGNKPDRSVLTADEGRQVLSYAHRVEDGKLVDPLASRWATALLAAARPGECLGFQRDRYDRETGLMDLSWKLERITFEHGCGDGPIDGKKWPCGKIHGGRCSERRLRVPEDADIEYEFAQLHGGLCLTRPKTDAGRRLMPAPPPLQASINQHLDMDTGPNPHNLMWHMPDGRPINPDDDRAGWEALLTGAGVPVVDLYEARHTTVTLLMEAGVDASIIAAIAGHSSLAVQEAYKHASVQHKLDALTKVSDMLYRVDEDDGERTAIEEGHHQGDED